MRRRSPCRPNFETRREPTPAPKRRACRRPRTALSPSPAPRTVRRRRWPSRRCDATSRRRRGRSERPWREARCRSTVASRVAVEPTGRERRPGGRPLVARSKAERESRRSRRGLYWAGAAEKTASPIGCPTSIPPAHSARHPTAHAERYAPTTIGVGRHRCRRDPRRRMGRRRPRRRRDLRPRVPLSTAPRSPAARAPRSAHWHRRASADPSW